MREPTTPTGKRLATLPAPGPGVRWPDAIIAIEQEAAEAERDVCGNCGKPESEHRKDHPLMPAECPAKEAEREPSR